MVAFFEDTLEKIILHNSIVCLEYNLITVCLSVGISLLILKLLEHWKRASSNRGIQIMHDFSLFCFFNSFEYLRDALCNHGNEINLKDGFSQIILFLKVFQNELCCDKSIMILKLLCMYLLHERMSDITKNPFKIQISPLKCVWISSWCIVCLVLTMFFY